MKFWCSRDTAASCCCSITVASCEDLKLPKVTNACWPWHKMTSCNPTDETRRSTTTQRDRQAFHDFSTIYHFSKSRTIPPSPLMNNSLSPQLQEIHSPPAATDMAVTKACPNCGFAFRVKQDSVNQEYCSKGLLWNFLDCSDCSFSTILTNVPFTILFFS